MDLCSEDPCKNGAACEQHSNSFKCLCDGDWTGKLCDIPYVSCAVAAKNKGVPESELCQNGGTCHNRGEAHTCSCRRGYEGSYCELNINECASQPCLNGALCKDMIGGYSCQCRKGYQGVNCEIDIDDCAVNLCMNGGICHDMINNFTCSCPPGTTGYLCEDDHNDCLINRCHNGGTCKDKVGGYECICPPGFVGHRCEGDVNECLANPCDPYGTQDCVQLDNDYRCDCKPGWTGRTCNSHIHCDENPCHNNGLCKDTEQGANCTCLTGFAGTYCQIITSDCEPNPCANMGTCLLTGTGYECDCMPGSSGVNCQVDDFDDCQPDPCQNGGICLNRIGYSDCMCPQGWAGIRCEVKDDSSPGGLGRPVAPERPPIPTVCLENDCPAKAGNGICNMECNRIECDFDNTECSYGTHPWENCTQIVQGRHCWDLYKNGECNQECNNEKCLYDGFDCQEEVKDCLYDAYCLPHYNNGDCDKGCNTKECGWDGFDCDASQKQIVPGSLYVVVLIEPEEFQLIKKTFVRQLSHLLRAGCSIKKAPNGEDMIYPWHQTVPDDENLSPAAGALERAKRWAKQWLAGSPAVSGLDGSRQAAEQTLSRRKRAILTGSQVYLEIDNRLCFKYEDFECFGSTDHIAKFVAAELLNDDFKPPVAIHQIGTKSGGNPLDPDSSSSAMDLLVPIIVVCTGIIVITLIIIMVLNRSRKRAHGITWFPDGFFSTVAEGATPARNRKGPDGEEMQVKLDKLDGNDNHTSPPPSNENWQVDDDEDRPQTKKPKLERQGRSLDKSGNMLVQQTLTSTAALTPPQGEDTLHGSVNDINVRGPDGYTALMLASIRGEGLGGDDDDSTSGSGEGGEGETNTSVDVISTLLMQGAAINAQTDRTGETSLHLAARYARADAAKVLLDAGADPNAEDSAGRTPLHTAVSADAQGVFRILLRNRSTNLNARMNCGSTPLILACRLAVEDMVEELIVADAEIEATDSYGRTALHWAAAVNNVDAVLTLLRNNANRDVQDNKEETPLFLAAREGSYETVKVLLEHYANRDMTDHMDQLPRDVALERRHTDIVELLDNYKLASPASVHLAIGGMRPSTTSPGGGLQNAQNHPAFGHGMVNGYAMPPNKVKAKGGRKNKKEGSGDASSRATAGAQGGNAANGKAPPKSKKKKDGANSTGQKAQMKQLQPAGASPPISVQPIQPSGVQGLASQVQDGNHHQTLNGNPIQSQQQHTHLSSSNDSSPMSTISPSSYSVESHHSPSGYDLYDTTSPLYDAFGSLPANVGEDTTNLFTVLNDLQAMANGYADSQLLDQAMLPEWNNSSIKSNLQLQQHQPQQQLQGVAKKQHNVSGNRLASGDLSLLRQPQQQQVKGKGHMPMSPTHYQAIQQHAQQRAGVHRSPHHKSPAAVNSFHADGSHSSVTPSQQHYSAATLQHQQKSLQNQQQHHLQQAQQQLQSLPLYQHLSQQQSSLQHQNLAEVGTVSHPSTGVILGNNLTNYPSPREQFPTPPSHSSQHLTDSPPHQPHPVSTSAAVTISGLNSTTTNTNNNSSNNTNTFPPFRPDHNVYSLTPSPDSPCGWSSSPNSDHSGWSGSEGISSPVPPITHAPHHPRHKRLVQTEQAYF